MLAHGEDPQTGEKVQNLRRPSGPPANAAEVYAFADSDGRVTPRWLRALAAPLAEPGVGASTGYPLVHARAAHVLAADAQRVGRRGAGVAWGPAEPPSPGADRWRSARRLFSRSESWAHGRSTVSDDYALSAAVQRAGLRIAYAPGALAPSRERLSAGQFLEWARRQMPLTRVYRPAFVVSGVSSVRCLLRRHGGVGRGRDQGYRLAALALIAQLSPGMWKGLNRATLAKAALPEYADWFKRHLWVHAIWTPLATWLWLIVLFASGFGHTIRWRGYTYDLNSDTEPRR